MTDVGDMIRTQELYKETMLNYLPKIFGYSSIFRAKRILEQLGRWSSGVGVLVIEAWDPELRSLAPRSKPGVVIHACDLSTGNGGRGGGATERPASLEQCKQRVTEDTWNLLLVFTQAHTWTATTPPPPATTIKFQRTSALIFKKCPNAHIFICLFSF